MSTSALSNEAPFSLIVLAIEVVELELVSVLFELLVPVARMERTGQRRVERVERDADGPCTPNSASSSSFAGTPSALTTAQKAVLASAASTTLVSQLFARRNAPCSFKRATRSTFCRRKSQLLRIR